MKEKPCCKIIVPSYMLEGPHMVHFNGIFVHPGKSNDYTIGIEEDNKTVIYCWNSDIKNMMERNQEIIISILKLDTGERWGVSNLEGVFIDTRIIY
jgi:hypothetical protein